MIYWELFVSFFQIGMLSFGGGYGALPLIEQEIIEGRAWMTTKEFIGVLTMSEMTPGSISINSATFVGNHIAGIPGSIAATLGVVTPSVVIVLLLAVLYYKFRNISMVQGVIQGLRPAVVALIAAAGVTILIASLFGESTFPVDFGNLNVISVLLIAGCLWLFHKTKLGPIQVMMLAGVIGMIAFSF